MVSGSKLNGVGHLKTNLKLKCNNTKIVKKTGKFTEKWFSTESILVFCCNLKKKNFSDLKLSQNSYIRNY